MSTLTSCCFQSTPSARRCSLLYENHGPHFGLQRRVTGPQFRLSWKHSWFIKGTSQLHLCKRQHGLALLYPSRRLWLPEVRCSHLWKHWLARHTSGWGQLWGTLYGPVIPISLPYREPQGLRQILNNGLAVDKGNMNMLLHILIQFLIPLTQAREGPRTSAFSKNQQEYFRI